MLKAPINIFFDVTPVGKILNIFTSKMNCFYGGIVDPFMHMMNMITHVLVVLYYLFAIGNWTIVIAALFGFYIISMKLGKPYMISDQQIVKIRSTLWSPIHSYFHESMRGKSIIRAFQQEHSITAKQNSLLDQTTIAWIVEHSCDAWFHIRMFYISTIFSVLTICLCAMGKGSIAVSTMVIALNYSTEMGWI